MTDFSDLADIVEWVICPVCGHQRGYEHQFLVCHPCQAHDKDKVAGVVIAYDAFLERRERDAAGILIEFASATVSIDRILKHWKDKQAEGVLMLGRGLPR